MAKETGIAWTSVTVDDAAAAGKDITNDIRSINITTPRGAIDITGLDKTAVERALGMSDGTINMVCSFNDAAAACFDVFKTIPTQASVGAGATRTVVAVISGQILTLEVIFTNFQIGRGTDGDTTITVDGQLADGVAPTWTT